jgi:hypothetical protein
VKEDIPLRGAQWNDNLHELYQAGS